MPGEDHQQLVAIGNFGHQQRAAGLRNRFHDQHSGHDRLFGKMSLKITVR